MKEGLIITISAGMYRDQQGYRRWLTNMITALNGDESKVYNFRQGSQPREDRNNSLLYLYLVIGGKIRYRLYYAGCRGECSIEFDDGRKMHGAAWLMGAGPVMRAPRPMIVMKGFQGFRYTEKLF